MSEQSGWWSQPGGERQPGEQPGWSSPPPGEPAQSWQQGQYGYGWQPGQQHPQGQPGQQPYGPPPGYGQPPDYRPYGYTPPPDNDGNAIAALVAAITSWVFCPIMPAVVALFLARAADRNIAASGGRKAGTGMAKAARIISWANIAIFTLLLGILLVGTIVAGASFNGGGTVGDSTF